MECPRLCTLQDDFMAIALLMFIMSNSCSFATSPSLYSPAHLHLVRDFVLLVKNNRTFLSSSSLVLVFVICERRAEIVLILSGPIRAVDSVQANTRQRNINPRNSKNSVQANTVYTPTKH